MTKPRIIRNVKELATWIAEKPRVKRKRLPDRGEAAMTLMREARLEVMWTNTAVKRVVKACAVLEIKDQDLLRVLQYLGIADHIKGNPYQKSIVRIWP